MVFASVLKSSAATDRRIERRPDRIRKSRSGQIPGAFAERVRKEAGIATVAIGLIPEARQAERIVAEGRADMVSLARGFLWDPRWAWHAALELGATPQIPRQYLRGRPEGRADIFGERRRA